METNLNKRFVSFEKMDIPTAYYLPSEVEEVIEKLEAKIKLKDRALRLIDAYLPDPTKSPDHNYNKMKDIAWKGYIGEGL